MGTNIKEIMKTLPHSLQPSDLKMKNSPEPIKRLFAQIRKMPELIQQAEVIDQVLINRLKDLKGTASVIINQLTEEKKVILQRFDSWIMPIAQGVLDTLLKDAEQLKDQLDEKLDHLDGITPNEWDDEAKRWAQLYSQWHNRQAIIEKILEAVVDRTKHLIDKDIKLIHDYQTQSLAHLPQTSSAFKNLEVRLKQSIEEPLKQLMNLRNESKEHTSLQQASEWIANLQERRESCFDQLLMKIDHVMKDVVHKDDNKDESLFLEIEGELIFMERELHHINTDLTIINLAHESEKQFILARLEGLLDHIEQLDEQELPIALQHQIQALKSDISHSLSHLQ
jgi:hypothetical protein